MSQFTVISEVSKHLGPGDHPNGSPQSIHGGSVGGGADDGRDEIADKVTESGGGSVDPKERMEGTHRETTEYVDPDSLEGATEEEIRAFKDPIVKRFGARIDEVREYSDEVTTIINKDGTTERRGGDSMAAHSHWGEDDSWHGWTKQRAAVQSQILNEMEMEHEATKDKIGTGRRVIVLAGPPGAGKTQVGVKMVLPELLKEAGIDPNEFLVLNPDSIKERLIEHDEANGLVPDTGDLDLQGMELASVYHEESSMMAKAHEASAMDRGLDVILDITMNNPDKIRKRLKAFRDAGYEVHTIGVMATQNEVAASTYVRSGESSDGTHVSRIVPEEFIGEMFDKSGRISGSSPFTTFNTVNEQGTDLVNGFSVVIRNNPVPKGFKENGKPIWNQPVLISSAMPPGMEMPQSIIDKYGHKAEEVTDEQDQ